MWGRVSDPPRPTEGRLALFLCGRGRLARVIFVAPPSRRLSWGRPAPTAEDRMPSRRRRYGFRGYSLREKTNCNLKSMVRIIF